jgi:hypothetical protein
VVLRCTAKLLALVGVRPATLADAPVSDDDWYLSLLWIGRRKCLLLTHAGTLFPILATDVRKAQIKPIGPYVVALIEEQLLSEGLPADTLGPLDAGHVQLAKTASRSILGVIGQLSDHRLTALFQSLSS